MAVKTGMMAFWADFEEQDIPALREWHNCQHMSERVNIPGFRLGRRYRGFDQAATFLMYYETVSPDVLASSAYRDRLNAPTDWTKKALKLFRNPCRAVFRLVEEVGQNLDEPAFYLATLRFNANGNREALVDEYKTRILPELEAQSNVVRARLWENQEHITAINTAESGIYGKGPGRQQFALFVESSTRPSPPSAAGLPGATAVGVAAHTDEISETGWLDFALR